ncbi:MAG: hypothetical protein NT175_02890 [Bacteroidetes bacterium]|nr:hypothetical protein [Bacteroidota bacterium]
MKIYAEDTTSNLISSKHAEIKDRIDNESESYILNVGETQYIEHLRSQFHIDFPEIHTDKVYVDTYEKEIPGNRFPVEFMIMDKSKYFKKDIIVYHIPYTGNIDLLRFRPNTFTSVIGIEIPIDSRTQTIKLEFINFYNDAEKIKRAYNERLGYLFSCFNFLKQEIEAYNSGLESFIRSTLLGRRQQLLKKNDFLSSLGVPLKKNPSTSETFAIPKPVLREKISIKPVVTEKGFKPEPTLDNDNYINILKIINDVGKNFERLPSVYAKKGEEDLRDHILLTLDPNFEFGSASGETFNKTGKTDILLRYDSSVVFVAECKFWSGEKKFLETIDQLLGYLTWRDSKTSVVVFVQNKDMTAVVETAKEATKKHGSFIRELAASDTSWFNYIFSLPTDKNKEIKMAVQLFHIP